MCFAVTRDSQFFCLQTWTNCFNKNHGCFARHNFFDRLWVYRVDIVDDNATIGRLIFQQAVCAPVEIITRNHFVTRSKYPSNDIRCCHTSTNDERSGCIHDLCKVSFKVVLVRFPERVQSYSDPPLTEPCLKVLV